jgi:Predicted membrane protein
MANQTERRPDTTQPSRSRRYNRQTAAHVEARRDGKPLIFGYGGHLTKTQKTQLQRLAIWVFIGLITLGVIGVFIGFWVNFSIVIPNLPIANVNGQNIPQSDFRKLVAVNGQLEANKIKGKNGLLAQESTAKQQVTTDQNNVTTAQNKVNDLNKQLKAAPTNSSQHSALQSQLTTAQQQLTTAQDQLKSAQNTVNSLTQQEQLEETLYTQEQMATQSAQWLQEDLTIRNWLKQQSSAVQNKVNPSSSAVTSAMNDLKAHLPSSTSYQQFLSSSNISDGDAQAAMTLIVRRNNMQSYLTQQITSPTRQVQVRSITFSTQKDANSVLKQLQGGADFATLAKAKSVDNNTKQQGGELGWLAPGQYMLNDGSNLGAVVDKWISDPSRKAGQLSPVLSENGTWHVLQIENVDPAHTISASNLKALKNNALTYWIALQKASGTTFSSPDTNKMFDPSNLPSWIPASAPVATGTATGAGTVPGTGTTGTGQ